MLPLFGLIPVFIVWFGIGELPKIILIALGAAIPLYLNTFAGIRSVDAKLAEVGQVLRLSKSETIRHVILPGALPQALTGLRQSLGVAWLALVVAEQVNANAGLGFMISQATQFLRNDVILVALAVCAVLGLLTDALVRLLERRALAWRRGLLNSRSRRDGSRARRAGARAALARALVREPSLLLLDEPFSALDALTRIAMHRLVLRLWERHRPAVLLVTHDVDEALVLADRVLVLASGRISFSGPVGVPRPRDRDHPGLVALRHRLLTEAGVTTEGQ